jgi:hypothetical protein
MRYVIVGILDTYADAEAAVEDLEQAGIMGGQVEVINDIDEDARTADTPGEPSTKPPAAKGNWIARLFGAGGPLAKPEVRALSGEQPNYIGDQEFYATHVKQGGAVMIVRTSTEESPAAPPRSCATTAPEPQAAKTARPSGSLISTTLLTHAYESNRLIMWLRGCK